MFKPRTWSLRLSECYFCPLLYWQSLPQQLHYLSQCIYYSLSIHVERKRLKYRKRFFLHSPQRNSRNIFLFKIKDEFIYWIWNFLEYWFFKPFLNRKCIPQFLWRGLSFSIFKSSYISPIIESWNNFKKGIQFNKKNKPLDFMACKPSVRNLTFSSPEIFLSPSLPTYKDAWNWK